MDHKKKIQIEQALLHKAGQPKKVEINLGSAKITLNKCFHVAESTNNVQFYSLNPINGNVRGVSILSADFRPVSAKNYYIITVDKKELIGYS